jgi:DNA repair protein SbcC/Rad50
MRPLKLTIEGFSCFREKQELDFSSLDLFAISGPTGAGKSSLLDAMIFALYGKVPRVGKNYSECISLGKDRLAVTLDFRVGERSYRVARIGKRKGSGSAQLEELIPGDDESKPLADQVREVDRQVEALLGLGYDAFTQAVVLPQNEFAQFLKSEPRERQKILSSLLRLDVYERMKKRAGEFASKLAASIKAYERRLMEDYAGATPQAVEGLAAKLDEIGKQNRARQKELDKAEKAFDLLKLHYEKSKDLDQQRTLLKKLDGLEPAMRVAEKRLLLARRAAPLLPLLDAAKGADEQAAESEARRSDQQKTVAKAERAVEQRTEKLEVAKAAASEVPALNKRIRALDELKGAIKAAESAEKKLSEAAEAKKKHEADRDGRQKELAKAKKDLAAQEKAIAELKAAVSAVGYDPARAKKLDAWRDRATQLSEQREQLLKATQSASAAEQRAARAKKDADEASERLRETEAQYEVATKAFKELEDAVRASEAEHSAFSLRTHLKVGEPCPVCEQSVAKLPSKGRLPKVESLKERCEAARPKLDALRARREEETRATSRIVATAEKSAEGARESREGVEELTTALSRLETKIDDGLGEIVGGRKSVPIEVRVREAVEAESDLREKFEAAESKRDEALERHATLERAKEKVDAAISGLDDKVASASTRIEELREEIDQIAADVRKVTKRPDPLVEREELAARCKALEDAVGTLEDELEELNRTLHAEQATAKEIQRQLDEQKKIAVRKRKEADAALEEAEFRSEKNVREAVIVAAEQKRLEKDIETHQRDTHAARQRIEELQKVLGDHLVTQSEYADGERRFQQLRTVHDEGIGLEASLKEQASELKRKLASAQDLTKRLEQERLECRQYDQLATDLRSDRFQEFILREAFAELVARASERLFKLSSRYTLAMADGEFDVLDRDNAGERRSARTLSGGETFLASLALALELSEQVQRAAGAVALDSLFIDEGFGSLDAEALDIATDAIQSLPQGGRMVGLITHISELTARLDSRVVVEKRPDGSRVRVEAG